MNELHHFRNNECQKFSDEIIDALNDLKQELINEFATHWTAVEQVIIQNLFDISSIEISLLRHSLLVNSPLFYVELFDENRCFGGLKWQHEYQLLTFTEIFNWACTDLLCNAKKYMGKIPKPMANKIMLECIVLFDEALANIFQEYIESNHSAYCNKENNKKIGISMGEYRRFQFEIR